MPGAMQLRAPGRRSRTNPEVLLSNRSRENQQPQRDGRKAGNRPECTTDSSSSHQDRTQAMHGTLPPECLRRNEFGELTFKGETSAAPRGTLSNEGGFNRPKSIKAVSIWTA